MTEQLSKVQAATLWYLSLGMTALEVAEFMECTPKGIESRIAEVRRKLGAKTLAHAVRLAIQKGVLTPPEPGTYMAHMPRRKMSMRKWPKMKTTTYTHQGYWLTGVPK